MGGKHRYLLGEAAALVPDSIEAFREATLGLMDIKPDLSLEALEAEHARLEDRIARFGDCPDATDIWTRLGIENPTSLPLLETARFPGRDRRKESLRWTPKPFFPACFRRATPSCSTGSSSPVPARCGATDVTVIGARNKAPIGVELAHRMAGAVLETVREHPGRPIVLLVDTSGQRLSRRDELLGVNGYMAHLAKCLELARRSGHRTLGLVYGEAVSGGFLATSLLADVCYALPEAEIRVMNLPAMARVTKIPLERLQELSKTSAVFAPGVENYHRMGAIRALWDGDLSAHLEAALAEPEEGDRRRQDGEARGGRTLARAVADRVRRDAA